MKTLFIFMAFLGHNLLFLLVTANSLFAASSVSVYAAGTYTESSVDVYLYADIIECNLVSYGVKLGYTPTDLTVSSAEKNETDWYFGEEDSKLPYMNPDVITSGEVVVVGGKLDINNPTAGVTGAGILLGHISFQRKNNNTPIFSLSYGKSGSYKNFVTTHWLILDDQVNGVMFNPVIVLNNLTDTDNDGIIDNIEDSNQNGIVDPGETDPNNPDSDGDTILDGVEDANQNGIVDAGETDPRIFDSVADENESKSNLLLLILPAIISSATR